MDGLRSRPGLQPDIRWETTRTRTARPRSFRATSRTFIATNRSFASFYRAQRNGGKVFRYPELRQGDTGEAHDAIRAHLAAHGYRIAEVTVDFGDFAWNEPYARCLARGDQGSIEELKRSFLPERADVPRFR